MHILLRNATTQKTGAAHALALHCVNMKNGLKVQGLISIVYHISPFEEL